MELFIAIGLILAVSAAVYFLAIKDDDDDSTGSGSSGGGLKDGPSSEVLK